MCEYGPIDGGWCQGPNLFWLYGGNKNLMERKNFDLIFFIDTLAS